MSNTTHTPAPWKVAVWNYSLATPPRKELQIETASILLATVQCDHNENNPYMVPKAEAEANARLMASAPDMLDALRRLLTVVKNRSASGPCCICGADICLDECAVRFASDTIDKAAEPEFEAAWNSPVPPYDPKVDGDYSSFLALNNCD